MFTNRQTFKLVKVKNPNNLPTPRNPRHKNIGNIQLFKKNYLNNFNFEKEKEYTFKICIINI